jgi:pyruvate/2-oxoglutarate dehydrogenase complex dihydrolipoamide dehydrogenase (E3) component
MTQRDLVIIGGGAGGLVVASVAAQLGLRVTLIEKAPKLGGDCLHYGCIPSKTLIHTARIAHGMRYADGAGLTAVEPEVDMARVNARIRAVIDHIQQHDDPERFRDYGCEVIFGAARFVDAHSVEVDGRRIAGKRFVIATGSRPAVPAIPGLQEAGYLTNLDLFSLPDRPRRLAVLGGGPIGLEMGQAFARLGSQVTILQRNARLLPQEDPELADELATCLQQEGITVHTGIEVTRVTRHDTGIRIEAGALSLEADQILVATGRRANVEDLGLEAAGVRCSQRGIEVDRRMRTSQKHIYACGDVCGPYAFTHMAEYQAGIVISNAVFRFPKKADYRIVPKVTFTDPELASVGLSEAQALQQGLDVTVLRFPFAQVDRALTEGETAGAIKLVVHKGKVLGATILGAQAGELLHEIVLAMQVGAKIGAISAAIHAYPTRAQIHRRVVNTYYGQKLFSPGTRRLVRWINRLLP